MEFALAHRRLRVQRLSQNAIVSNAIDSSTAWFTFHSNKLIVRIYSTARVYLNIRYTYYTRSCTQVWYAHTNTLIVWIRILYANHIRIRVQFGYSATAWKEIKALTYHIQYRSRISYLRIRVQFGYRHGMVWYGNTLFNDAGPDSNLLVSTGGILYLRSQILLLYSRHKLKATRQTCKLRHVLSLTISTKSWNIFISEVTGFKSIKRIWRITDIASATLPL